MNLSVAVTISTIMPIRHDDHREFRPFKASHPDSRSEITVAFTAPVDLVKGLVSLVAVESDPDSFQIGSLQVLQPEVDTEMFAYIMVEIRTGAIGLLSFGTNRCSEATNIPCSLTL